MEISPNHVSLGEKGGSKFTSDKNLSRSHANQSTKFPIFGKAEDFVADSPPSVETRSNDVGMT